MPKVKCKNVNCKFNNCDGKCNKKNIIISYKGCDSFEKNLSYYINLVWDKFKTTNMIFLFELDNDLRIGLYYVMEIYGLYYKNNTFGNDSFITLHRDDIKNRAALSYTDIISIEMDDDKFFYHYEKFINGELPPYKDDDSEKEIKKNKIEPKINHQPFGWLSPTGDFIEADWGDHEQAAIDIVNKNKFTNEYNEWSQNQEYNYYCRDFLVSNKGYALIHNPSLSGKYKVTHSKELTKKQKNFLYGYFIDMGDTLSAEKYLNE